MSAAVVKDAAWGGRAVVYQHGKHEGWLTMAREARQILARILCVVFVGALAVTWPGASALIGQGRRAVTFPAPPHPDAIGTHVGGISTYVSSVTVSPPVSIHRSGLVYREIRGTIRGVGWGGMPIALCHRNLEPDMVISAH